MSLIGMGIVGLLRLFYISIILPPITHLLLIYAKIYRYLQIPSQILKSSREIQYWQTHKDELLLGFQNGGYRSQVKVVGLTERDLEHLKKSGDNKDANILADIDQDGFFLPRIKSLKNVPLVSSEKFLKRKKFTLQLISFKGNLGIKKDYHGNRVKFLNELKALHNLKQAGCHVPTIYDIDFGRPSITFSYINGKILREELVKHGAILRDRDVNENQDFILLPPKKRWLKRICEGRKHLSKVIDSSFIKRLIHELDQIHKEGYLLTDIKYGNIVIENETGQPYLIDFDLALKHPNIKSTIFQILRDMDRKLMNLHLGTDLLTYRQIKEKIKHKRLPAINKWYAPVYIGLGLKVGRIWDVDIGYGRWQYILKKNLPPFSGKRVLDLGANNSFIGMQMLRYGAKEVIGVELDQDHIKQGSFVKEAFEWADNKSYNFRYIHADMKQIPIMNLGRFDMVTAFCCIYYLDSQQIYDLIQYISTISKVLVLQCNTYTNISRKDNYTYKKASVDYTVNALKTNGFPNIQIISPRGYHRPLIIGKKT